MKSPLHHLLSVERALIGAILCISVILVSACRPMDTKPKEDLPRFTKLDAFNPHRASFECKHEAAVNPPVSPEAEALFQEALVAVRLVMYPQQRDYPKAAALYEQAMKLGHWKAQFNLAGLYLKGLGVPQDEEKALQLTEDLMRKGVPAAWENMGTYYMGGVGPLEQDATVAYAFWQKAADMGSMAAQTFIGEKLTATHDEPPSFWGNRPIGLKMLECAFAQGYGPAAYELGLALSGDDDPSLNKDNARALRVLHEGVKWGSEKCANYLFSSFHRGDALASKMIDKVRGERYNVLGDALYANPDLRFPNLDKVLPLPPARLPIWDGRPESLIEAAKAVVPTPPAQPKPVASPASKLTGKAHIPEGWMLPDRPAINVEDQHETTRAVEAGYWIARLLHPLTDEHHAWNAAQWPLQYAQGELFDRTRPGLRDDDGRIVFRYVGQPVPMPPPDVEPLAYKHPLVERGIARYGDRPEPPLLCKGNIPCRRTGVWEGRIPEDHAHAAVFNQWHRQTYAQEGHAFPDPHALHLEIAPREITWRWLAQANAGDPTEFMSIKVDEPQAFAAAHVPAPVAETHAQSDEADDGTSTDIIAMLPGSSDSPEPAPAQPSKKGRPGLLDRIWPPRG